MYLNIIVSDKPRLVVDEGLDMHVPSQQMIILFITDRRVDLDMLSKGVNRMPA